MSKHIDWGYINSSNKAALEAFLEDHTTDEMFSNEQDEGCMRGWKGKYNCTNYGLLSWILEESRRNKNQGGLEFLAQAARHLFKYGYDWEKHRPGGEGVRAHPVDEGDNNWDSDWLRHCHMAQYVEIFKAQDVPLSTMERWHLFAVLADWMHNWYLSMNWGDGYYSNRERGDLFQYGRGMIPARAMIAAYELMGDEQYLRAAETVFASTFFGLKRQVNTDFVAYDTGYPAEKRTQRLIYIAAHMNMEPWQAGYIGETAAYLNEYTKNPLCKKLIKEVILGITDWVVRPDIPYGDFEEDGDGKLRLSFLQGGSLDGIHGKQMTPEEALNLSHDQEFYPLCLLKAHYWDGGYWKENLPDKDLRIHYPRTNGGRPVGPKVDHATFYNWANLMMCRYFLTGEKNDLDWARWIYRDSKYFANRSSASDKRTLSDRDTLHYGTGNIGKTRTFVWWAAGSMWARKALEGLEKQEETVPYV